MLHSRSSLPKDRADDTYAVYSAILRKPTLDHPNSNRQYLIEDRTRVDDSKLRGCVHVPAEYAGKLEEVLAEYAHYKDGGFSWSASSQSTGPTCC